MTEKIDLRTKAEKDREAKHKAICREFANLANATPQAAAHRLFKVIAERHGMTTPGIRGIVMKAGLYAPK